MSLIHFSKEAIWLWALQRKNQSSVSIILILKWPASLPLPLICSGWHAPELFVTQTAFHMRVGLTSAHQERRMTHFTTPLNNCRGLSVKLLQRRGARENPAGQGGNEKHIASDSSSALCFMQLPSSFLFSFGVCVIVYADQAQPVRCWLKNHCT